MKRRDILETAIKTVYTGCPISPRDVAIMMILLKVARIKNGRNKNDNYVDIAGYAACAAESVEAQDDYNG